MAREAFGSIRQRGKRYLGRYYYRGRCYYTPTRQRKTDVRADLTEVQASILAGTWTPPKPRKRGAKPAGITPGRPTVEEYGRAWLITLARADASPNT
ncbi:MAG: hypothetical protein Q4B12_04980, partial [Bowdeniella nasicola]|nr:hypothetical protein [Bowdeniella nasicola]